MMDAAVSLPLRRAQCFRGGTKTHSSLTGPAILGSGGQVDRKLKAKVSEGQTPDFSPGLCSLKTCLCAVVGNVGGWWEVAERGQSDGPEES